MKKHVSSPEWEHRFHRAMECKREAWERIERLEEALERVRRLFYGAVAVIVCLTVVIAVMGRIIIAN